MKHSCVGIQSVTNQVARVSAFSHYMEDCISRTVMRLDYVDGDLPHHKIKLRFIRMVPLTLSNNRSTQLLSELPRRNGAAQEEWSCPGGMVLGRII